MEPIFLGRFARRTEQPCFSPSRKERGGFLERRCPRRRAPEFGGFLEGRVPPRPLSAGKPFNHEWTRINTNGTDFFGALRAGDGTAVFLAEPLGARRVLERRCPHRRAARQWRGRIRFLVTNGATGAQEGGRSAGFRKGACPLRRGVQLSAVSRENGQKMSKMLKTWSKMA